MTPKPYEPEVLPVVLRKLDLKAGDILHIAVGISDLGDNQGPWIPTNEELDRASIEWQEVVPEDVTVITTHFGVVPEIVRATS